MQPDQLLDALPAQRRRRRALTRFDAQPIPQAAQLLVGACHVVLRALRGGRLLFAQALGAQLGRRERAAQLRRQCGAALALRLSKLVVSENGTLPRRLRTA